VDGVFVLIPPNFWPKPANVSTPFPGSLMPRNSLESRPVIFMHWSVGITLRRRRLAKIAPAIVHAIAINMIHNSHWPLAGHP
jgi:hypothetical protein